MRGLLLGSDEAVFKALCRIFNLFPIQYDMAIGIVEDGALVGGVILHWWNGSNIYLDYYGPKTVTLGLIRALAELILERFDVARVTFQVHKNDKRLTRWFQHSQLGARYEGNINCFYGKEDRPKNIACQYALLRPQLERLVRRKELVHG